MHKGDSKSIFGIFWGLIKLIVAILLILTALVGLSSCSKEELKPMEWDYSNLTGYNNNNGQNHYCSYGFGGCNLTAQTGYDNRWFCEEHFYVVMATRSDCPSTQCKGETLVGDRCKNETKNCIGYCYHHTNQANQGNCQRVRCSKIFTTINKQCEYYTTLCGGICYLHK
jgi:hypothetical protein